MKLLFQLAWRCVKQKYTHFIIFFFGPISIIIEKEKRNQSSYLNRNACLPWGPATLSSTYQKLHLTFILTNQVSCCDLSSVLLSKKNPIGRAKVEFLMIFCRIILLNLVPKGCGKWKKNKNKIDPSFLFFGLCRVSEFAVGYSHHWTA